MADVQNRVPDAGVWLRVEAAASAAAVRRTAERLAEQVALPATRIAHLAIVASEITSNLVKHAEQGIVLVRPVRNEHYAGVELIAADHGPGMADVQRSFGDGHSTAGTLGIGLGSIARQSGWYDVYSLPGRGTVLAVQVWPASAPELSWACGVVRPISGGTVSGDAWAARCVDGRRQVLLCDGLGHGPLAAAAAQRAVGVFHQAPAEAPDDLVRRLHRELEQTRGAALAVAELDAAAALVRYAGLGDIAGVVVGPDGTRRSMVSLPGTAGDNAPLIRQYDYPLACGAAVVLHSDGVTSRWSPADYPGLFDHAPQVIAATLLRDAGTRRDDAGVAVAHTA
ncbi:SpoIIE family protein phosphatase [Actinoplanes sp. DH11]|uniref:SpoIIE family protein phosphatase n=1 Tax=Actinoplanes sp. DH11 TaxID=2857011 RepID=UPI0035ADCD3A